MLNSDPTDIEIRDAVGVTLIDHRRNWYESVGGIGGKHTSDAGAFLRIPVDSSDKASVAGWRHRVVQLREKRAT